MSLHWETIKPSMRQVLDGFGRSRLSASFYLAGGTALALQLGHRHSVDLDFFSASEDIPSIRQALIAALAEFNPVLSSSAWGNLVFLAEGVRVGFYGYGYALVEPLLTETSVPLAGLADIGLMKLDALLARASRKDFHDLYVICQHLPLRQLLALAPQKYPGVRDFEAQVARHLVDFAHAEQEEPPNLFQEVPWTVVKAFFQQQAVDLGRGWLK